MRYYGLFVTLVGFLNLSMGPYDGREILSEQDLQIERDSASDPAIHTADDSEASYLTWQCFQTKSVLRAACFDESSREITRCNTDEDCDGLGHGLIEINTDGKVLKFEVEHQLAIHCFEDAEKWKDLISKSAIVCLFAAPWPSEEPKFWALYGMKTEKGQVMAPIFSPNDSGENN